MNGKHKKEKNRKCKFYYCRHHADFEKVQVLGEADVQAAVVVLAGHHPRLPQHDDWSHRAPQPARMADRIPL